MSDKKTDKKSEKSFALTLINMTKEAADIAAEAEGFKTRVVEQDGQHFAGTCDYRFDRINLYITNGLIVKAAIG